MNKFNKEDIVELIYSGKGCIFEDLNIKNVDILDNGKGRWNSYHTLIIQDLTTNTYYSYEYEIGLTEYQDYRSYDEDPDILELTEVTPVEKIITTIEWKEVK
jgi:hypothetical protein